MSRSPAPRLITPTPNPSPQARGAFAGVAAKSPSPMRGGVRGGGIFVPYCECVSQ